MYITYFYKPVIILNTYLYNLFCDHVHCFFCCCMVTKNILKINKRVFLPRPQQVDIWFLTFSVGNNRELGQIFKNVQLDCCNFI